MIAAEVGAEEVAAALLERHANLDAQDGDGTTALMFAVWHGRTSLVKRLLDAGADPNSSRKLGKETALLLAAGQKDPNILQMLLDKGAHVNVADRSGLTPLMRAAMGGSLDFNLNTRGRIALPIHVKLLIEHGADVNAQDDRNNTALSFALEARTSPAVPASATADDIEKINAAYAQVVTLLRNAGAH
jgi:ankyrin repeat protein